MEIKKTITSIFMLPTLKIAKERLLENGYINGYSKDDTRDVHYDDAVYILFKPKNLDRFRIFLDSEYERTKSVIDDYDYPDGYVVVVYKLNPLFKSDFDLIKQGQYSKTSKEFQEMFPMKIVVVKDGLRREVYSLQYKVFNKSKELVEYWEDKLGMNLDKDQELWYMFYDNVETLNLDKIKEHV